METTVTRWLKRNAWAFPVIVVMVVLIAVTVVRPQWWRSVGYQQPRLTVPFGQAAELDGVSWQLVPIMLPEGLLESAPGPPGSRLVAYALSRSVDGKPAGLGPNLGACLVSVTDAEGRRWLSRPALSLFGWTREHGFDTICTSYSREPKKGPLLVTAQVAIDAQIVAVDVHLAKEVDEDAEMLPDTENSELTVRFETS
jgi:hypothetical protein